MAEQSKDILSEYTKDMTPEQRAELQEKVSNMTEEELKEFRNSLDPDSIIHCCLHCGVGVNGWMGKGHRACRKAHQKEVAYGLCYHVL